MTLWLEQIRFIISMLVLFFKSLSCFVKHWTDPKLKEASRGLHLKSKKEVKKPFPMECNVMLKGH